MNLSLEFDDFAIEIVSNFVNMESARVCCQQIHGFLYDDLKPSSYGDFTILV